MSSHLTAFRRLAIAICIVVLTACGSSRQSQRLSLTIAHVNDTHSHLEPSDNECETFVIDGVNTSVKVGGVTRLKTALDELRASREHVLFLHAGDAVQGTLYFNVFQGDADFDFLNFLGVDAMTFGNHEFDNDFLARGGDGFTALKNTGFDIGIIDADVLGDYLHFLGTVGNPTEQRVTVLTTIAGYRLRSVARSLRFPEVRPGLLRKAAGRKPSTTFACQNPTAGLW